ncbi:MAG: ABC transporter substrate-binding protein [Schaalia hyovaginalis]|uniref:peptide ABC transporter substrate-binding protein n=1 Tax=Schaalia TaxID=2529408 RepID=UPI0012B31FF6|nr:ABC transporter substrate-binding protein [Schaalia hyovaginalis]MCF2711376.1 ABC transporter substrate-binding protein [Schaalia hyovaginalis]MCI6410297.1 ABC transporter substrate-binding protein [Schaalia hyovaginalis]MCI6557810.1 ABC transporter substrate-binding protein [Schaalia hyovaginalis]MCI7512527.1 ABC transporter substrate-binding protein [Schaalia hyovaginalis]MCI7671260.1 ABC transporter substrate-binding protein [Schaalia hyovaginalis]
MNLKRTWLAVPAVLALGLTACSSGGTASDSSASGAAAGSSTAVITTNGSEPQNPLIPANTNETGGGKILDLIFAGLVYYDAEGATHMEMAESIEPNEDASVWTVKLKKGQKFSDGTEVQAHNFIEAWKMGAKEAMLSSYFYAPIQGADDEGAGDLTGLEEIDDYTFTIALKEPTADWSQRLGYSAYVPLPDSTLADPATGGEKPIGNGPYMVAENGWEHNAQIKLIPNPEYKGDNVAKNGGVNIIFYASQDAAYQDLLGHNLDVLDAIPDSAFATYESELEGRSANQAAAIFQSFAIPMKLEHFSGDEGKLRRQALSYAIDRDTITETIFSGTRTPAKDFTSPVVDGYNDAVPGSEVLSYNPEKAKELWAEADKISPWSGTFTIGYNSDGGHQAWVDAVANSIKNTLGIDAVGNPYPDFKSLRTEVTNRTITGAFRTGWQADYPGKYNFLAPLYGTGAGSNDTDYSNADFDALLTKSASAPSVEESNKLLDQAQEILFKDLPVVPLWYSNVVGGWAPTVDNVVFNWKSVPVYQNITKAE